MFEDEEDEEVNADDAFEVEDACFCTAARRADGLKDWVPGAALDIPVTNETESLPATEQFQGANSGKAPNALPKAHFYANGQPLAQSNTYL
jgi:hypothetical protein